MKDRRAGVVAKSLFLSLTLVSSGAEAKALSIECLGNKLGAKGQLVYLHGFEPLSAQSGEEQENRGTLLKLAEAFHLRIAIPKGPVCPQKRLCWPAKEAADVAATFRSIQDSLPKCLDATKPYTLLGFSNGGYFAFKIYKMHKDPRLTRIIASSSSGLWDPKVDRPNPLSRFQLMIGDRDITLKDARAFTALFQESVPDFTLKVFAGGHRLDYEAVASLLR